MLLPSLAAGAHVAASSLNAAGRPDEVTSLVDALVAALEPSLRATTSRMLMGTRLETHHAGDGSHIPQVLIVSANILSSGARCLYSSDPSRLTLSSLGSWGSTLSAKSCRLDQEKSSSSPHKVGLMIIAVPRS